MELLQALAAAQEGRRSALSPQPVRTSCVHPVRNGVQLIAEQVAVPVLDRGHRLPPPVSARRSLGRSSPVLEFADGFPEPPAAGDGLPPEVLGRPARPV